ncbi:MAG: hypothetical protein JNK11_18705, partial [Alphaproteobacteria bacterium]|nr:hypothetical protein [Alphaproteobacteria bacterium]
IVDAEQLGGTMLERLAELFDEDQAHGAARPAAPIRSPKAAQAAARGRSGAGQAKQVRG